MNAVKIVGAAGNRRPGDFYPTPKECVYALVDFLKIRKHDRIWEPACGDGAIVNALKDRGYTNVYGTDIQTGLDFLEATAVPSKCPIKEADWIITNPPFSLAESFIWHASDMGVPFAYLLKAQYWHSARRLPLFEQITPRYILPLTWRPDFTGQGNSLMDVMWCIWLPGTCGVTIYQPLEKPKEGE